MDAYEATQVVFARVQAQDPDNVSKIIGFLLLQDRSEQDMARLACASEPLLQSAIARARRELGLPSSEQLHHRPAPLFIPDGSYDFPAPGTKLPCHPHHLHRHQHAAAGAAHSIDPLPQPQQSEWCGGGVDSPSFAMLKHGYAGPSANAGKRHVSIHQQHHHHNRQQQHEEQHPISTSASTLSWKPCLYYSRGYCKHGTGCRFLHGGQDSSPSSSPSSPSSSSCAFVEEEDGLSLERLEMELQELLRGRRAPVSIASLPQLYYERFGKALQAQGYLTESQRHGKTGGCSLTKLLAKLKGTVTLIDSRPHGQHAVVLADEAQRIFGYRADRDDLKDASPSSRQIYLTFPAESSFSEEDVSTHFSAYGPVQDVRIPYQQKRMFGFVTFLYPETVKMILGEGNPHYICGARVLVKPYREKAKLNERKMDTTLRAAPPQLRDANFYDALSRRILDEERLLDMERRRLMAAEKLVQARLLLSEQETLMNGIHVSPTSPLTNGVIHSDHDSHHETPAVLQQQQQQQQPVPADVPALTSEEIPHFGSGNPFGFVMDVLEGENSDEAPVASSRCSPERKIESSNNGSSNIEALRSKRGHYLLPESPFSTPQDNLNTTTLVSEEEALNNSVQEKLLGLNLSDVFSPRTSHNELLSPRDSLICCICYKHCVEPSKLECSHTFCVQCILKVIRGSKDECPICRQHIGSQVYKILHKRDLHSWLSPTTTKQLNHRVAQHIW